MRGDDDGAERNDRRGSEAIGSVLGERLNFRTIVTVCTISPLLGRERKESTETYV